MSKEELLEVLRENLTISITTSYESGYYNDKYHKIKVEIKFDDEDFDIIRVEEGRGKLKGHAIFVCQIENKKEFKAKLKGETAYLKELFENPKLWQGKKASVKFQGFSKYKIPRFPVAKSCRNYE